MVRFIQDQCADAGLAQSIDQRPHLRGRRGVVGVGVTVSRDGLLLASGMSRCRGGFLVGLGVLSRLRQDRLVRRDGEERWRSQVRRRPGRQARVGHAAICRQKVLQPREPLVPDRERRGEHERWLSEPPEDLEAERRLAGPRSRDDVKTVVLQVAIGALENPSLIGPPAPAEPKPTGGRPPGHFRLTAPQ